MSILSFFISDCTDLDPLFFFLMSVAKGLSILYFQRMFLVSLIFSIVVFVSIYFCSDLYDFFLTLDFVCSFSSCFWCKVRFVRFFLVSSSKVVLL